MVKKICKCCGEWYKPDPDEFDDTRICNDCFRENEQMQGCPEYDTFSDADPGL